MHCVYVYRMCAAIVKKKKKRGKNDWILNSGEINKKESLNSKPLKHKPNVTKAVLYQSSYKNNNHQTTARSTVGMEIYFHVVMSYDSLILWRSTLSSSTFKLPLVTPIQTTSIQNFCFKKNHFFLQEKMCGCWVYAALHPVPLTRYIISWVKLTVPNWWVSLSNTQDWIQVLSPLG